MPVIRVLDANMNRAAEGMRVLEDIARFILENQQLCGAIKNCRHSLREQSPTLYSRDTFGDVGTGITTAQEKNRGSIHDIALAASHRCGEALRVVEEFLKLHNAENTIESIRYKMYDLSAEIMKQLGSTNRQQWKCCFVMTRNDCVLPWEETMTAAISAGCDCVQVREKTMSTHEYIDHVIEVKQIADEHDVPVIVNDRLDVMLATNTAGIHLGKNDMSIPDARKICGKEPIIGATAHTQEEINSAIEAGADYIGVGAMFASITKPNANVIGTELLKSVKNVNHLAIGGITPDNVQKLYEFGCKGIAVNYAIAQSTTPGKIVHELLQPEAQLI